MKNKRYKLIKKVNAIALAGLMITSFSGYRDESKEKSEIDFGE